MLDDLGSYAAGAVEDDVGLLQALQDLPRHGPKPARTGLDGRLEDAPERIQIVAEDPGSPARQGVHDVRVGVIAHVVEVEAVALPPEDPWIVPEPVQKPISVDTSRLRARGTGSRVKRRAKGGQTRTGSTTGASALPRRSRSISATRSMLGQSSSSRSQITARRGSVISTGSGKVPRARLAPLVSSRTARR